MCGNATLQRLRGQAMHRRRCSRHWHALPEQARLVVAPSAPQQQLSQRNVQYCEENDWQDFGGLAFRDAQRLAKLMAAAADSLMPEPTLSTNLKKDVFDVLLQNVRCPFHIIACVMSTHIQLLHA